MYRGLHTDSNPCNFWRSIIPFFKTSFVSFFLSPLPMYILNTHCHRLVRQDCHGYVIYKQKHKWFRRNCRKHWKVMPGQTWGKKAILRTELSNLFFLPPRSLLKIQPQNCSHIFNVILRISFYIVFQLREGCSIFKEKEKRY